MNVQNKLNEFYFNLETLELVKNEELKTIISMMSDAGFNSDLIELLLNLNKNYLTSVLVRLKYFLQNPQKNKENLDLFLQKYSNFKPLVDYLFLENLVKKDVFKNCDKLESIEIPNNEDEANSTENLKSEVKSPEKLDSESETESFFDTYLSNQVEKTEDKTQKVKSNEFYSHFTQWYSNKYGEDVPPKKELKNYLNLKLGKSVKSSWQGVVLK